MLRTLSLVSGLRNVNGSVISSLRWRQTVLCNQNITNDPLTAGGLVKLCSTKSTAVSTHQPPPDEESTNWHTIYHFPFIMLTASLKRLKFYPLVVTGLSVPVSIGMAYVNVWSLTTAEVVGAVGLTTSLTLALFSFFTDNLVGFVYCDDRLSKVKISFLDSKGKRKNRIYFVDDLVSRSELPKSLLKVYFSVKNYENNDVYKLIHQYGEIYDVQAFNKVFGQEPLSK